MNTNTRDSAKPPTHGVSMSVAIGIALDLTYSVRMGYLDRPCANRILDLLEAVGFRLWDDALLERDGTGQLTGPLRLVDERWHP